MCAVFSISGCRSGITDFHLREDTDFSFIKKVAVVPFENYTAEKTAGEVARQAVINELLVSGAVDVAFPGDTLTAYEKTRVTGPLSLTSDQIKTLGNTLKVQAIIFGAVNRFGEIKSGSFNAPEISITLMMAEAGSGTIIWSITDSKVGDSFLSRHFGARSDTLSETLMKTVRESVRTLTK
jgi:hypothetical protein